MKSRSTKLRTLIQTISMLLLAVCAAETPGTAETLAGLTIQTYAGLTITGEVVDTIYQVEYTTDLEQTNDWRIAGVLRLPTKLHLWFDQAAPVGEKRFYRAAAVTVEPVTNMAWIPPGSFTMGSPETEAERNSLEDLQTVVTLTRGFFMGKYEVTQGEYAEVMGNNPSFFRNGTNAVGSGGVVTNESRHPVETLNWYQASNYCARLSERERTAGRLPAGWEYRLPTEAEWEYACRAGTTSAFHYGTALRSGMANFQGTEEYDSSLGTTNNPDGIVLGRTTEVGSYEPNGWGLYDMHGNVWEWCSDWWDGRGLPGGRVFDPLGPSSRPSLVAGQVYRGGGWTGLARYCRSSNRNGNRSRDPGFVVNGIGFRVALSSRR